MFPSCTAFGASGAVLQTVEGSNPEGSEGGFASDPDGLGLGEPGCFTRDTAPFALAISLAEAEVCAEQIHAHCEAIGTPIP